MHLRFFDDLILFSDLPKEVYCNALWVVQHDNSKHGVMPDRAYPYLDACLPHGPKNPAIFYNAAAVLFELGDIDGSIGQIQNAATHGFKALEKIRDEKGFIPLRKDPRFLAVFAHLDPPIWDDLTVALEHADQVQHLSLKQLEVIPEEILQFKNLEVLQIGFSSFQFVPLWIASFSKLRKLYLICCPIREFPDEILAMPALREAGFYENNLPKKYQQTQINALLTGFAKTNASYETRLFHIALLLNKEKEARERGGFRELVHALNSNLAQVRSFALRLLSKELGHVEFPIIKDAEIFIAGKLNADVDVLEEKLTRVSMSIGKKINQKTAVIVLGEQPKGKVDALFEAGKPFALEEHLKAALDAIETPYLIEEADKNSATAERLSSLLMSSDSATVKVAISMMKTGGVPKGIFEELLLVIQNSGHDKKTREDAKKLFAQYAPIELRDAVKNIFAHTSVYFVGETTLKTRLNELATESHDAIDSVKLAKLLLPWRRGVLFLFEKSKKDPGLAFEVLETLRQGNTLNLRALELKTLPTVLNQLTGIKKLVLSGNHFSKIPEVIFELTDLEVLDISSMRLSALSSHVNKLTQFESLPASMKKLTSLRILNLSFGELGSCPAWLIELPALEELNLNYTTIKDELSSQEVLSKLRAKGVKVRQ